jgi:hypothetical protein
MTFKWDESEIAKRIFLQFSLCPGAKYETTKKNVISTQHKLQMPLDTLSSSSCFASFNLYGFVYIFARKNIAIFFFILLILNECKEKREVRENNFIYEFI